MLFCKLHHTLNKIKNDHTEVKLPGYDSWQNDYTVPNWIPCKVLILLHLPLRTDRMGELCSCFLFA